MAVARRPGRNCIGCEKILKLGVELEALVREDMVEVTVRENAKRYGSWSY
jgi:hypothetical protein